MAALLILAFVQRGFAGADPAPENDTYFETRIRPLLAENCFKCHGPQKQESDIRLDVRSVVLEGGDPLVVPGKPEQSRLIEVVRQSGDFKMPPKGKLRDDAIAVLETWVKMGAPWPEDAASDHATRHKRLAEATAANWAFQPIQHPPLPAVRHATLVQSPVDHFVFRKLEEAGLSPAPRADRRTLIRRATFDLIGLPPTPDEVEAFVRDTSPDAWANVVDRLLVSPHYGERWARHWLDVARYADTKGYILFEDGNFPWAYTYRDYVIRAMNEDLPYDRFIVQQIAADRLPLEDDKRPLAALGFLTLGNRFIGNVHDVIDDRIDVITRGLMGLTVSCARCHDHKFDPITMEDYYALYGVMASSAEPLVPPLLEAPPSTPQYEAFAKELESRKQKLAAYIGGKYAELERSARARSAEYLLAAHALRGKPPTDDFMLIADGSDLNPTLIKLWQAHLESSRRSREPVFAVWHALADLPEAEFSVQAPRVITAYAKPDAPVKASAIVLRHCLEKPPANLRELAALYAEVLLEVDRQWQQRLAEAAAEHATVAALDDADSEALRQVLYGPDSPCRLERTPTGDLALLPDRASQDERRKLLAEIEEWWTKAAGAPPRAMALEDRAVPIEPRVFGRGNPRNLRQAIPRRFLRVLSRGEPKPFSQGSGRLELAQAIANRDNPLTARVLVNFVWLHHFGSGLVRTPGNFGTRGEPPTHPELLDYLAATFMDEGWSLKKLHRTILLAAAYQQSSLDRPQCQAVDPDNRLLWRFPRRRLDFESLRDAMLFVSGRLDPALYGPPNQALADADATRRTIYSAIDRLNLPGLLRTFDFPSPDSSSAQRQATTVPQQGLFLMNHPLPQAAAKRLVERADIAGAATVDEKVDRLYRLLFARPPTAEELAAARDFLGGAAAAAWTTYAHSLLLTNEFAFIE